MRVADKSGAAGPADSTPDVLQGEIARLEAILARAPDAVIVTAADGRIETFNAAAETLFGYAAAEILGQPVEILVPETLHENHAVYRDKFTADPAYTRRMTAERVVQARRRDGSCFDCSISIARAESLSGISVIAIARDVSKTVQASSDLAAMSAKLGEQLEKANAASAAKTRFLAQMSHELRTPLNAIIGFSEVMRDAILGEINPPRYREYIDDIHTSGKHLLALISDILDVSRIEHGKYAIDLEPCSPRELIRRALSAVKPLANEKGLRLRVSAPRHLPDVSCDLRAMHQCLLNLLSNAIKFSPARGRITVLAFSLDEDTLRFSVADEGPGIDPAKLQELGQPFTQFGNSMLAENSGTGLGLSITKSLTELMGGKLSIASAPTGGVIARIDLPQFRPGTTWKPLAATPLAAKPAAGSGES